jgi:hypothetical protein
MIAGSSGFFSTVSARDHEAAAKGAWRHGSDVVAEAAVAASAGAAMADFMIMELAGWAGRVAEPAP